jgi:hypothetical protein
MGLFSLFTSLDEYNVEYPDQFGRARYYSSKNRDILTPTVSKEIYKSGFSPFYPGNKKFAVCISHDIDKIFEWKSISAASASAAKELRSLNWKAALNEGQNFFKIRPYRHFNLDKLFDLHNKYKIRSTYFLQGFEKNEIDFNYQLSVIKNAVAKAFDKNNEIGFHGSPAAIKDISKLKKEKDKIESFFNIEISGHRSHFLSFDLPDTWKHLSKLGISYDSTIGYPDMMGFRNGMCYPYYPYDPLEKKFLDIVELPLVLMDSTIFIYMRLGRDIFLKIAERLIEEVKQCGGVLTILWHNHHLHSPYLDYYIDLLELLQKHDPWITTGKELINWWKENDLLSQSQSRLRELLEI